MSIKRKIINANDSAWLSNSLTQEETITANYIAQIAVIIQKQRKAKGYTQHDLAHKLGVSQALVSRWENGEENFTVATLAKISTALELKLNIPLEKLAV